jgi:RimJ/RimL family protein N-acetyltransferase
MIEAERIVLRALTRDDAAAIVADDREGRPWAEDYPTPGDVMVATSALAGGHSFATDAAPWGLFTIAERSSDRDIGGIGFKSTPSDLGEVEIGYGVCRTYWGRGVATDAVNAICEFASGRARSVLAETDRANVASQRVLEKCGFTRVEETDTMIRWRRELA